MATKGNLDVALRIQADVAEALTQLRAVRGELGNLQSQAGKPNAGTATALQQTTQASRDAAQALSGLALSNEQLERAERRRAEILARTAGSTQQQAEQARRYQDFLRGQAAASDEAARSNRGLAVSAGQTRAAMRQLPAQITDVVTSLASGQAVWMVAIQQGGQIKDSFGGIGPAARALVGAINPVTLAIGALAAVAAGVAAVFIAGQRDLTAYNLAIQSTGNFAGATRGRIDELAESASRASGISVGAAREIAVQMVQSGQLGIGTIANLTRATQGFAVTTGRSVAAAGTALADMFVRPAEAAEKLDAQFHFLTATQLQYIRQLVEQGRVEQAQLELSQRLADHLGGAYVQNLGYVERAWKSVTDAIKGAVQSALAFGRADTIEQRIAKARTALEALQEDLRVQGETPALLNALVGAQDQLDQLLAEKAREDDKADAARVAGETDARVKRLSEQGRALVEQLRTNREKFAAEKKKLDEIFAVAPESIGGQAGYDKLLAALRERFKDPKGPVDRTENAFAQKRVELTRQLAEATNALANARDGEAASTDKVATALEAWLQTAPLAKKFTGDQVAELRTLAREADEAAKKLALLREETKRRERITAGVADVDAALAALTGDRVDATVSKVEERYRKLYADLATEAGNGGQAAADAFAAMFNIDRLIDLTRARAKFTQLRDDVERVFSDDAFAQRRIDADQRAFRLSPAEAQDQRVAQARRTAGALEAQLPAMEEQARVLGDPRLFDQIDALRQRIIELRDESSLLQQSLTQTFAGGLASAIEGLATGTLSLRDAARGLLLDMARGMAQVAAQELASLATKKLLILLTGEQAAATVAAQTTQTTAAVAGITTVAAAQTAASTTVAAAAAPAAAATATWSFGAAALAGLVALAAIYALAKGFESGGAIRGPGTGTSDSIPIWASNGEFMVRERSASQPGARAFLDDFNARGMAALQAWGGGWQRFAEGGMVVNGAMPSAAGAARELPSPATSLRADMAVYNLFDADDLAQRIAQSSHFEQAVVNQVGRNGTKIQRSWQS